MGLNARLKRLERAQEPQEQYRLYSPAGDDLTDAEIIQKPERYKPGLARLKDGKELPVEYCPDDTVIVNFEGGKMPGKLLWCKRDVTMVVNDLQGAGDVINVLLPPGMTEEDI